MSFIENIAQAVNDPQIDLTSIFRLESSLGSDERTKTYNPKGPSGGFQLSPDAIIDIQREFPNAWWKDMNHEEITMNPALAGPAAGAYFDVLKRYLNRWNLPVSVDSLLVGYNKGPKSMKDFAAGRLSYDKLPKETRDYIQYYHESGGKR